MQDQGSIYIGTEGVLYAPYIDAPVLLPAEKFKDDKLPESRRRRPLPPVRRGLPRQRQDDGAVRLLRPADRVGPARLPGDPVPQQTLEWDAANLKVTNVQEANAFVRRQYRKGWEIPGL